MPSSSSKRFLEESDDDENGPWPHLNLSPHRKVSNDFNSKIMLVAIVSLSVVILLVIALHIYARCVLRRQARRRAAIRQLGLTVAHARSSQQPKPGLDATVIASLPVFVFKQRDDRDHHHDQDDESATECAVCLSRLANEEMARLLPNCKHIFHAECIDKWLGSHSTCPICRTEAQPLVQPVSREGPAGLAGGITAPTDPRLGSLQNPGVSYMEEGTSDGCSQSTEKASGSTSRLNSFKRILSRERSSRIIHSCSGEDDAIEDLERQ
ncbi:hypothetical protein I3843_03G178700 [Carya illinoinensis]|uniref:RING-type E3 ubiquitin transferase n=1 Tax=Carya illinoinensis TaxID=32201 RepID=A0A8T1R5C6_CARIL|nr:E3 ubiquitin-protein ligase ATL41-like [Carya illinoinensis]KAG6661593.1 hypothetical protein CIPAW_03G184800 [Carya illinoinensis]KAG6722764.1 hypothetical protein I3842_03G176600 [Carya illinoinensis]KAG7988262.1 hypothetical protein I3843_03G178700 [Carya illinoinensis]